MDSISFMENEVQGREYWEARPVTDEKKDWRDNADWIEGYWNSRSHLHRLLLLDELAKLPAFDSVLEVGCNCGPNLSLIQERFKTPVLTGIDVNRDAVYLGEAMMPEVDFKVMGVEELAQFPDKSYDVVLADAVLMYVSKEKIQEVVDHLVRIARKAIVLVEWEHASEEGVVENYHWARNYGALLGARGLEVRKVKIGKDFWPTKTWSELGYIYIGLSPQA